MERMEIRKARADDLQAVLSIYDTAKAYMKEHGNPTQWPSYYPAEQDFWEYQEKGELFVGVDEDEKLRMVFAFCIGEEPTYQVIEDGAWLNDDKYGTIHMLASDGTEHGCFRTCLEFCKNRITNLRADTHEDNQIMNALLSKNGFVRCGIIYVGNGTPRNAYQWQTK